MFSMYWSAEALLSQKLATLFNMKYSKWLCIVEGLKFSNLLLTMVYNQYISINGS